jgi:type IV secretory pathway component VirB8
MEQNPLKIYEEGYVKPETNSKKYIWIMSIILSICILLIIFGIVIVFLAASLLPTI